MNAMNRLNAPKPNINGVNTKCRNPTLIIRVIEGKGSSGGSQMAAPSAASGVVYV